MRRQEVVEQLSQRTLAQPVNQARHFRMVIALIAEVLPHVRPVTLLYPRIVVLTIGSAPGEEHWVGPLHQIGYQMVIDELPTIVAVQAQQRKRQALFQMRD